MKRLFPIAALSLFGCSFLGLADYDVPDCTYDASKLADSCERLCAYGGCTDCVRYQCDTSTKRCVLRPKDADRDGDLDVKCGGTDCNDSDKSVNGKKLVEDTCDGVDDNCDGHVDENLLKPLGPVFELMPSETHPGDGVVVRDPRTHSAVASVVRSASTAPCVYANSDTADGSLDACAPLPLDSLRPAEPYARIFESSFPPVLAAVYTRQDTTCQTIALRTSAGGALDLPCTGEPASLPAIIGVRQREPYNADALVAYFTRSLGVGACVGAAPFALKIAPVSGTTTNAPKIFGQPITLASSSRSIRPAAMAVVDEGPSSTSVLIAAPDDKLGVGMWIVSENLTGVISILGPFTAGASEAFSVDLEVAANDELALIVQSGCSTGNVTLVLGSLTRDANGALTGVAVSKLVPVGVPAGESMPSIAWIGDPYDEWRVTTVGDTSVSVQRLARNGEPVGQSFEVGVDTNGVAFGGNGSHGNVIVAGANPVVGMVRSFPIGCPK